MSTTKYKYRLSASVPGHVVQALYSALDDESKPHNVTVRRINPAARKAGATHLVVIENNDRDYFAAILTRCK